MNSPKISIIIATFNAGKTLEACLKSISAQTYKNYEILIADGVSTDNTLSILDSHSAEIAHRVSEKDKGIYDAWNKVIPHAKGEWLYFLGADDELFSPDTLSSAAIVLGTASENVVYGKVAVILPNGETLNVEGEPWEKVGKKFRHEMTIPHQGTFHRNELFKKYGLFDPTFKICGDYEFLLRELKDHSARFISDLTIARMGFGGASSTYKNVPKIITELKRAQDKNGIPFSIPVFFRWVRYFIRQQIRTFFGHRFSDFIADLYRKMTGKPRLWGRFHD